MNESKQVKEQTNEKVRDKIKRKKETASFSNFHP
jgi:hypothetical protein